MKVIKRDGTSVDYDRDKIKIAINKANLKVSVDEQASDIQIKNIIKYIEGLNKKRILVEDIQDIIEEKLMSIGKFALAKEYITYRYTRALVRKANTTDESILGLIKSTSTTSNKYYLSNSFSNQRDIIAGEVSKDLSKRILLPTKITEAHENNIIFIHDLEYFMQPIICASYINLQDMLDNGTSINGVYLDTPTNFFEACINLSKILVNLAASNFQGQTINLTCLGKYLELSKNITRKNIATSSSNFLDKNIINTQLETLIASELSSGIDLIIGQLNSLSLFNKSIATMNIYLNTEKGNKYNKENIQITQEFLLQLSTKYANIKNNFPKIIYTLDDCNSSLDNTLTKLTINCIQNGINMYLLSSKVMKKNYNNIFPPIGDNYFIKSEAGTFNQGTVTLNLPQIAIMADGNLDEFWKILDERLELCKEALLCRHHSLIGVNSNSSSIHWENGGISRTNKDIKIDGLLKSCNSTLTLGYLGLFETTNSLNADEPTDLYKSILKHLNEKCKEWSDEFGIKFNLSGIYDLNVCRQFIQNDLEQYGKIKGITDKAHYLPGYELNIKGTNNNTQRLQLESELQCSSLGGNLCILNLNNINSLNADLFSFIYNNIQFTKIEIDT